jgi:uracil-DNA glycosylase
MRKPLKTLSSVTPVKLDALLEQVRACRVCEAHLPHGPRPVLRVTMTSRLLIVGQAPSRKVHESGIPWDDASGDLLRDWLQLSRDQFYDESRVALIPTGLCYPGTEKGADLPPRPECAPLWHPPLRAALPNIRLTLLVGRYAQAYYLGKRQGKTLADTVRNHREFLPDFFPLPHPSPRNRRWMRLNPWFDAEVVPLLRQRVDLALQE